MVIKSMKQQMKNSKLKCCVHQFHASRKVFRVETYCPREFSQLFTKNTYISSSGWFSMSSRFGISNISTLSEKDTLGVLLPDDATE